MRARRHDERNLIAKISSTPACSRHDRNDILDVAYFNIIRAMLQQRGRMHLAAVNDESDCHGREMVYLRPSISH